MFALVRFQNEKALHVVSTDDVQDFNPEDENDFDSRRMYSVFWKDERGEESDFYPAQILMLAGKLVLLCSCFAWVYRNQFPETEEELRGRGKRVRKPKIPYDDVVDMEEPGGSQKKKVMQVW